jgi:hypothetical protein
VDADDGQRLAGYEVAELVEDAVVGEVVLGEGQHHLAAVEHGGGVPRGARGAAEGGGDVLGAVQVAHDHGHFAQPLDGETARERGQRGAAGLDEGAAQGEVLDRVAGEHHLGERDEVRALGDRVARPLHDGFGVALEVADGGVDLVQGET